MSDAKASKTGKRYVTGEAPHWRAALTSSEYQWQAVLSLVPAWLLYLLTDRQRAFWILAVSLCCALAVAYLSARSFGRKSCFSDGSAVLTAMLFAYASQWMPRPVSAAGAAWSMFFALLVAKDCFGGWGQNIFHPALIGVAALAAFEKDGSVARAAQSGIQEGAFVLRSAVIAAGGIYLVVKRGISWRPLVSFMICILAVSFISVRLQAQLRWWDPVVLFGAIYFVSDGPTSPIAPWAKVCYGFLCGLLAALLLVWGSLFEALSCAVLTMNAVTPLLDRYLRLGLLRARPRSILE